MGQALSFLNPFLFHQRYSGQGTTESGHAYPQKYPDQSEKLWVSEVTVRAIIPCKHGPLSSLTNRQHIMFLRLTSVVYDT